jgi:hypothetical protein
MYLILAVTLGTFNDTPAFATQLLITVASGDAFAFPALPICAR